MPDIRFNAMTPRENHGLQKRAEDVGASTHPVRGQEPGEGGRVSTSSRSPAAGLNSFVRFPDQLQVRGNKREGGMRFVQHLVIQEVGQEAPQAIFAGFGDRMAENRLRSGSAPGETLE